MNNRPTCARCAIKHLAQARALMLEAKKGYPLHVYYALGHMAEAEDEMVDMMPDEAGEVRAERLKLENSLRDSSSYVPGWARLILMIAKGAMLEEVQ